jgi:hypothetical protein
VNAIFSDGRARVEHLDSSQLFDLNKNATAGQAHFSLFSLVMPISRGLYFVSIMKCNECLLKLENREGKIFFKIKKLSQETQRRAVLITTKLISKTKYLAVSFNSISVYDFRKKTQTTADIREIENGFKHPLFH